MVWGLGAKSLGGGGVEGGGGNNVSLTQTLTLSLIYFHPCKSPALSPGSALVRYPYLNYK